MKTSSLKSGLLRAQIAWALLVVVVWAAKVMSSPIDPDYAAGELYDHVLHWGETGQLYVPLGSAPFRVLNYPPGFLALVHWLHQLGMNALLAGRLLTLLSIAGCVLIVYRWLRREGCSSLEASALVSLLAGSFSATYFVGQLHIQWSADLFTLWGYYLLSVRGEDGRGSRRNAVLAGGSLALACFFKQSQAVPGLIAFAYLVARERQRLLPFVAGGLGVAIPGAVWLQLAFGPELWRQILQYTVGSFGLHHLVSGLAVYVAEWSVFGLFGLWLAVRRPRDIRFWYFAGASLWMLSSARRGAGPQYFIDWYLATLVWIGPAATAWLARIMPRRPVEWAAVGAMLLQIIFADAYTAVSLAPEANLLTRTQAVLPSLCRAMPRDQRLVVVEWASVARACGHQATLQPFIMTMLAREGLWDEGAFVHDLERGAFPVVLLPFNLHGDLVLHDIDRWSDPMIEAMAKRYQNAEQVGDWFVLRPTSEAPVARDVPQ